MGTFTVRVDQEQLQLIRQGLMALRIDRALHASWRQKAANLGYLFADVANDTVAKEDDLHDFTM